MNALIFANPIFKCIRRLCLALVLTGCVADDNKQSSHHAINEPVYELGPNNPEACESLGQGINKNALLNSPPCLRLSDYRLFKDKNNPRSLPNYPGFSYQLNSALFSDYAQKYRYIFLPEDSKGELQPMTYRVNKSFEFPLGTVLVKVFALPDNTEHLQTNHIVEVRLLIYRENGWLALPYIWNEELQDGYFSSRGTVIPHQLKQGKNTIDLYYRVPTYASCGNCHNVGSGLTPIGTKTRHLNKNHQLQQWAAAGLLNELPEDNASLIIAPNWRDTSAPLQQRAKAYLDINCAHCHNDNGAAALSGLRLEYWRNLGYSHGVCNSAHGWRGGGFDIWPGRGDDSSLPLRMELNGAADRMPPIGRSVADDEAVALIRAWIDTLPAQDCASG